MDENPYRAEDTPEPSDDRGDHLWSMFYWGVVGFGGGTLVMMQFVLSISVRERTIGGMACGGLPLAALGAYYGHIRWRRKRPNDEP
jgi:hypothetical protein